jgi:hypothetical protein
MNTTATAAPPKTQSIKPTTQTIKIYIKGNGQVIEHRTWYKQDETITFVSDKEASLAFANRKLFNIDGVQLEADVPVELTPNYPEESRFWVSDVTIKGTGFRVLTQVDFEGFARPDPPVIVPGGG